MKKSFLLLSFIFIFPVLTFSWGSWGHQHINRAAVFSLPDPLKDFFYKHIDFITEEAVMPDVRKYSMHDKAEFPRHYINLEAYCNAPFDSLPLTMKDAEKNFDEKKLSDFGILPWYIVEMTEKLSNAFKNREKGAILMLAGDLGHYIGDATMPLHTCINHDGQHSGQHGIHAFFESQLPEMYGSTYNLNAGEAHYISDIVMESRNIIMHSHSLSDSVLLVDKQLRLIFGKEKMYATDKDGKQLKNIYGSPIHSKEYAEKYHEQLHSMVERQIRIGINELASFWYTAWVNAGKPDLSGLDGNDFSAENKLKFDLENNMFKKGKLIQIGSKREF